MNEQVIIRVLRGAAGGYTATLMKVTEIFSWNGHVPNTVPSGDEFGKIMVRQLKNHKFSDRIMRGGCYNFYNADGELIKDTWKKSSE